MLRARRSIEAMVRRWEDDLRRLDSLGFNLADGHLDPATEVNRNLATAIAEGEMLLAMTDEAFEERQKLGQIRNA